MYFKLNKHKIFGEFPLLYCSVNNFGMRQKVSHLMSITEKKGHTIFAISAKNRRASACSALLAKSMHKVRWPCTARAAAQT